LGLQEAKEAKKILQDIMHPATKEQIAIIIKRLSLHCGMQSKEPQEVKYMFIDYCHDLANYPAFLIEEACAKYRTKHEGNKFLPSSGQIIALIDEKYKKIKFIQMRIDQILGTYSPIGSQTNHNKPISLNEALSKLI